MTSDGKRLRHRETEKLHRARLNASFTELASIVPWTGMGSTSLAGKSLTKSAILNQTYSHILNLHARINELEEANGLQLTRWPLSGHSRNDQSQIPETRYSSRLAKSGGRNTHYNSNNTQAVPSRTSSRRISKRVRVYDEDSDDLNSKSESESDDSFEPQKNSRRGRPPKSTPVSSTTSSSHEEIPPTVLEEQQIPQDSISQHEGKDYVFPAVQPSSTDLLRTALVNAMSHGNGNGLVGNISMPALPSPMAVPFGGDKDTIASLSPIMIKNSILPMGLLPTPITSDLSPALLNYSPKKSGES